MNTWILVADESRARLFRAGVSDGELEEIAAIEHPEGRMHGRELTDDEPDSSHTSVGGVHHGYQPHTPVHEKISREFARELADLLEAGRVSHAFDQLTLVAEPKFLGMLRSTLSHEVSKLVVRSLSRNYTQSTAEQIREVLNAD